MFEGGLSAVLHLDFVIQDLDELLLLKDDVLDEARLGGRRIDLAERQLIQSVVDLAWVERLGRDVVLRQL